MDKQTISLDIQPETSIYTIFRRLSYKVTSALSEFIDNSTASYYKNKERLQKNPGYKLKIDIIYYKGSKIYKNDSEPYISIEDNAYGMDIEDFKRSILLNKPPSDTSGRNEFGMGLKTAACWFGIKWETYSSALDSDDAYSAVIDTNFLEKTKANKIEINHDKTEKTSHFTKIIIRNLLQPISRYSAKDLTLSLASIYRRDIQEGNIIIRYIEKTEIDTTGYRFSDGTADTFWRSINDVPAINFVEPGIYSEIADSGDSLVFRKEIEAVAISDIDNKEYKISGFIAIRDKWSKSNAGFSLFRRGRVVKGGLIDNYRPNIIFGNAGLAVHSRLFGEINLDNWPVNQAKDGFSWEGGLEEKFIDIMKNISSEYVKKITILAKNAKVNINNYKPSEIAKNTKEINDTANNLCQKEKPLFNKVDISSPVKKEDEEDDAFALDARVEVNNNENNVFLMNIRSSTKGITEIKEWMSIQKTSNIDDKIPEYKVTMFLNHNFFGKFNGKKEFIFLIREFVYALSAAVIQSKYFLDGGDSNNQLSVLRYLNQYLTDKTLNKNYESQNVLNEQDDEEVTV